MTEEWAFVVVYGLRQYMALHLEFYPTRAEAVQRKEEHADNKFSNSFEVCVLRTEDLPPRIHAVVGSLGLLQKPERDTGVSVIHNLGGRLHNAFWVDNVTLEERAALTEAECLEE